MPIRSRWEGRKIRLMPHPGPSFALRIKTPARNNSLERKVAQLKGEGTVNTASSWTEVCTCNVENNRN